MGFNQFGLREGLGGDIPPLRLSTGRDDNVLFLIPKGLSYDNNIEGPITSYRFANSDMTLNIGFGVIKVQRTDPSSIRKDDKATIFKRITEENKVELNLLTELPNWQTVAWFPFDLKDINLDDYLVYVGRGEDLSSHELKRLRHRGVEPSKIFASYLRGNPLYKDVFGMGDSIPQIRTVHKESVSIDDSNIVHFIEEGIPPNIYHTTFKDNDKEISELIKLEEGEKIFMLSHYEKLDGALLVLSNRFSKEVKTLRASDAGLRKFSSENKTFSGVAYYVSKDWDVVGCIHDTWSLHYEIYTKDPDVLTGMFDCEKCEVTVRVIDDIEGYREVIRNPGKTIVVMPEGLTLANFVPESKDFEDVILEAFEQDFDEGTEPCI